MATVISKGAAIEVLNLTLSSTDDIQIGFINSVNSCTIKARTAVDIQVRSSRSNPLYYTIPSGSSLTLDLRGIESGGVTQPFNVWIRSVSATPVVEIIGTYGG